MPINGQCHAIARDSRQVTYGATARVSALTSVILFLALLPYPSPSPCSSLFRISQLFWIGAEPHPRQQTPGFKLNDTPALFNLSVIYGFIALSELQERRKF
jgi:hypothetical protein